MIDPKPMETTPLVAEAADVEEVAAPAAAVISGTAARRPATPFTKVHLQTFSTIPTKHRRSKSLESGDVLAVVSKQAKTRQRKNVGKFRRKKQDYATWKGRIGVHVEYDEFDLKQLVNVIYQTLSTDWELVDCYDVIR